MLPWIVFKSAIMKKILFLLIIIECLILPGRSWASLFSIPHRPKQAGAKLGKATDRDVDVLSRQIDLNRELQKRIDIELLRGRIVIREKIGNFQPASGEIFSVEDARARILKNLFIFEDDRAYPGGMNFTNPAGLHYMDFNRTRDIEFYK